MLIYSYINTRGNWENSKLCENIFRVDIQLYQHEWKLGKLEMRSVFTQFRVFPISTSVDITVYQHGKNVLYLLTYGNKGLYFYVIITIIYRQIFKF